VVQSNDHNIDPVTFLQADKFGYYTITFVNDKCLSKSDVWYIFSKFGTVACVNGTFDCKKGRVFVSYKEKQGALNALETMLITKEYHLQVSCRLLLWSGANPTTFERTNIGQIVFVSKNPCKKSADLHPRQGNLLQRNFLQGSTKPLLTTVVKNTVFKTHRATRGAVTHDIRIGSWGLFY
jgi:hypothetical protein